MSDTANRNSNDPMDFDALAELFLGETQDAPNGTAEAPIEFPDAIAGKIGISHDPDHEPASLAPKAITIEALVMGHLPVRTGPWLSQYAATVARNEGHPVGMIRLGDRARLDLYALDDSTGLGGAGERHSLEDALTAAAPHCQRWMIQVGDLDVPWLLRSSEVQAITLLAGGNEAAVVDAYRTIKSLVTGTENHDEAEIESHATLHMPDMRLAIMGASRERAEAVADRLREASRAFLNCEIELAPGVTEMGPTGATPLFNAPTSMDTREILDVLRRAPRPVVESKRIPDVRPRPLDPPDEPAFVAVEPPLLIDEPAQPDQDEPVVSQNCRPTRTSWPGNLPNQIPGLTALDIPYPDDPAVEFAIDENARLHVMRFEAGESGAAVASLTAAGAWAARHVALINLAIAPRGPIRLDAATALHLFTSRPTAVRSLLDADVRIHALTPVPRDRDWVTLDLN